MSNFIFKLGIIDKKLLLPVVYIIVYSLLFIYWDSKEYKEVAFYLKCFGYSIGLLLTIFVNIAFKYKSYKHRTKNNDKKYIKYYSILFLIYIFYCSSEIFSLHTEEKNESLKVLYINDSFELIFLTLITYFVLKYRYYIHHFISIALFVLISILFDVFLENFTHTNILTVTNSLLYVLTDSLVYSYLKYLVRFKYYYSLDVFFMLGLINLSLDILSFIIHILIQNIKGDPTLINLFAEYYDKFGVWNMIFNFLLSLVFDGFSGGILESLIIDKLTPNYIIIGYEIAKIPSSIIFSETSNKWFFAILSFFQMISLLFYLELFECNFCSLNKNTKRSILKRMQNFTEENEDDYEDDEIEIKGYDFRETIKNQEIEVKEKEANEEKNEDYETVN